MRHFNIIYPKIHDFKHNLSIYIRIYRNDLETVNNVGINLNSAGEHICVFTEDMLDMPMSFDFWILHIKDDLNYHSPTPRTISVFM